jgi:hypothetical protein
VVSSAVIQDPEVAQWVEACGARAESFTATVKGFDDEPMALWVMTPAADERQPADG